MIIRMILSSTLAKVCEFSKNESLNKAVPKAVDYCIEHDILKDFLLRERKAVIMYSLYEYNKTGHMKAIKEEAFEDGRKEGIEGTVVILRGIGLDDDTICEKISTQYNLNPEQAKTYL